MKDSYFDLTLNSQPPANSARRHGVAMPQWRNERLLTWLLKNALQYLLVIGLPSSRNATSPRLLTQTLEAR